MPASRRQFLLAAAAAPLAARLGRASEPAPLAPDATAFAADLYGKLGAKPGNVFVSPFSVRVALAMTAAGARGDTLAEFQKVLRLPADPAATDAALGKLLAGVNGKGKPAGTRGYELRGANALWAAAGYPFRPEFLARTKAVYGAGAEECDFARAPDPSRVRINDWVAKETSGKIKDLLPPGVVTPLTRLVLTNAVYFKGLWAAPFRKPLTKDAPFLLADGGKATVPLMHRYGDFRAADDPAKPYQAAEVAYQGGDLSMLLVVPRDPAGLPAVEKLLTADWLKQVRASLAAADGGELFLPRFKVEAEYNLNDALRALGLKLAFADGAADFTGMSSAEKLFVSAVVHKAFADVNEEGTEAAAATGVVMAARSAAPSQRKRVVVRADRPFLFAIRHDPTDTVLFAGRYVGK